MDEAVKEIRRIFEEGRETCEHYHGIKDSYDDCQCTHEMNKALGSWCAVDVCPLLREH
jgi:hypothetical protein